MMRYYIYCYDNGNHDRHQMILVDDYFQDGLKLYRCSLCGNDVAVREEHFP